MNPGRDRYDFASIEDQNRIDLVFAELAAAGFAVGATEMGENITTQGIDLLALPRGARLPT